MEFTTHFGLHSQTTRLSEDGSGPRRLRPHGAITLSDVPFQVNFDGVASGASASAGHNSLAIDTRDWPARAVPASLAVTGGILVSFFSSAY